MTINKESRIAFERQYCEEYKIPLADIRDDGWLGIDTRSNYVNAHAACAWEWFRRGFESVTAGA